MVITSGIIKDEIPLKLWTREEYYRLGEMDILTSDEPVELINGQIIKQIGNQSPFHRAIMTDIAQMLKHFLGYHVLVRTELPITLNNYSEPKPDIAVPLIVRYRRNLVSEMTILWHQ
ncbi:MAG TPA: Uma2 family endonuclease [Allocoleopsis sp.]